MIRLNFAPRNVEQQKGKVMKPRTIIGIVLIVAGAWKLANMWGVIENDWLWRQPWTMYIAPVALIYLGALVIINSYRQHHKSAADEADADGFFMTFVHTAGKGTKKK